MHTRSGRTIVFTKEDTRPTTTFLTTGMIRDTCDTSAHICAFCRKRFNLSASHSLLQCPTCQDVFHLQCMSDFIVHSDDQTVKCPCCRAIVPLEIVDGYVSTEKLEKEWYFDFDALVQSNIDEAFHDDDSDHEEDDEEEDDDEENSEGSSDFSSDDMSDGSDSDA